MSARNSESARSPELRTDRRNTVIGLLSATIFALLVACVAQFVAHRSTIDDLTRTSGELQETRQHADAPELRESLDRTSRAYNNQLAENERLVTLLRSVKLDPSAEPLLPADRPAVSGHVLATKRKRTTELLEISIGSDDGLTEGEDLFVYRSDERARLLGRVRIVLVTPDRAVGHVTHRGKNAEFRRDDFVSTTL